MTGSVASFGFRASSQTQANRSTSSVARFAFGAAAGILATGSSGIYFNDGAQKHWLPPSNVPIGRVAKDGRVIIDPVWYQAFNYLFNERLGGPIAPSIPEISTNVVAVKQVAAQAQSDTAEAYSIAVSSAESANATREVAIRNNLAGATSIPKAGRAPALEP